MLQNMIKPVFENKDLGTKYKESVFQGNIKIICKSTYCIGGRVIDVSLIISIVCSIISVVITIVIAYFQIRQSIRMEKFERLQDERDEKRYLDKIDTEARSFISKYYEKKELIPLCAIAYMYNKTYHYSGKIYSEFLQLSKDTQQEIINICNYDLEIEEIDSFYNMCLTFLEHASKKIYIGEDKNIFYDNGKYLERALTRYGKEKIPEMPSAGKINGLCGEFDYLFSSYVSDTLYEHKGDKPITTICRKYDFNYTSEIVACFIALSIAKKTAFNNCFENEDSNKNYGYPDENLETMEDYFLCTLFEIYTNLVLNP